MATPSLAPIFTTNLLGVPYVDEDEKLFDRELPHPIVAPESVVVFENTPVAHTFPTLSRVILLVEVAQYLLPLVLLALGLETHNTLPVDENLVTVAQLSSVTLGKLPLK
ncbi:hypothetical protein [Hymenobacter jeollabukensis]|uniref:hypothetical protein n=1 Tax=Hymenobacter jeollabukensis TaxID=2025313 RepID=UPI001485209A|nr:hypothetical protein [Hymenobacter jeollabukensis]